MGFRKNLQDEFLKIPGLPARAVKDRRTIYASAADNHPRLDPPRKRSYIRIHASYFRLG